MGTLLGTLFSAKLIFLREKGPKKDPTKKLELLQITYW